MTWSRQVLVCLCMLAWCCCPVGAAAITLQRHAGGLHGNVLNQRSWSRRPHLGEAENPGPLSGFGGFDDGEAEAWSEDSCPEWENPSSLECSLAPPTADEVARTRDESVQDVGSCSTEKAAASIAASKQQQWLAANEGKEFVPAKAAKRVTKASKFEGQRVGWTFKTGDLGSGTTGTGGWF